MDSSAVMGEAIRDRMKESLKALKPSYAEQLRKPLEVLSE